MTANKDSIGSDVKLFGFDAFDIDVLIKVFEVQENLQEVWVFGSRARGGFKEKSDLDLVIVTSDTLETRYSTISELQFAIDESDFCYAVDLKEWNKITSPIFQKEVERDKVLLWKRK
jgi:uncharacterized protein